MREKDIKEVFNIGGNFWSVIYFGVFNFGTSYLGAKIGQNKTMTKISRFTVVPWVDKGYDMKNAM
jgi:hypothetical protein